jgi:hypothetical protein
MSSYILHAYPVWDTLNTLSQNPSDSETQKQLSHWLTFWLTSFVITNSPVPDMFQWIMITALYFPFSTEKVRTMLMKYMPYVEQKAGEGFAVLKKSVAEKLSKIEQPIDNGENSSVISQLSGYLMKKFY